jgi:hypothetical protein
MAAFCLCLSLQQALAGPALYTTFLIFFHDPFTNFLDISALVSF